jgi:ATP synthase protein I
MSGPDIDRDEKENSSYFRAMRKAGPLFGSGIQLAASVVLMYFLGRWADEAYNTKPWLMLVGIFFGIGAGLFNFIKIVNRLEKKSKK